MVDTELFVKSPSNWPLTLNKLTVILLFVACKLLSIFIVTALCSRNGILTEVFMRSTTAPFTITSSATFVIVAAPSLPIMMSSSTSSSQTTLSSPIERAPSNSYTLVSIKFKVSLLPYSSSS